MIKISFLIILIIVSGSVCAKSTCADIHGQQEYPPLNIKNGTICFVQEPVMDRKTKMPTAVNAIFLYYIVNGNVPEKAEGQGLLYDDTQGKIVDAFSLIVGRDNREEIFVIHSMEARASLAEPNSSGQFYSVSVFVPDGSELRRDESASEWFGADYSWLSDGRKVIYKYPYQSKRDVQQALASPFAILMNMPEFIPVRLKDKSYLFGGPNVKNKTRKYLIEGGLATVEKITAGWCQISYLRRKKRLEMWLMCDALDVGAPAKN